MQSWSDHATAARESAAHAQAVSAEVKRRVSLRHSISAMARSRMLRAQYRAAVSLAYLEQTRQE